MLRGSLSVAHRYLLASGERQREMGVEIARLRSSAWQQGPQLAAMKGLLAVALKERHEKAAVVERLEAALQSKRAQRQTAESKAEAIDKVAATRLELVQ